LLKSDWDHNREAILAKIPIFEAESLKEMLSVPVGPSDIDEVPP